MPKNSEPKSCTLPNGFECCVFCWVPFGAEDKDNPVPSPGIGGGVNYTYGPVFDVEEREKREYVGDTDPGHALAHIDCWKVWAINHNDGPQKTLLELGQDAEE